MSREDGTYIGQQVRALRRARGLTQQQLADMVRTADGEAVDRSYIAHIEAGRKPVDSRALLYSLASALSASVADLTGQPYEPADRQHLDAEATIARIQRALIAEGSDVISGGPRSLDQLTAAADKALLLRMQGDYVKLGNLVPGVISDLYAHLYAGTDTAVPLAALTRVTSAVAMGMKELGHVDLAWNAAQTAKLTAMQLGDPVALAAAEFVRSQVSLAVAATEQAASIADKAANALQGVDDEALQMRGMLHMQAALCMTTLSRQGRSEERAAAHFNEARDLAASTGEGRLYELRFGPTNVAVWDLSLAIERDEAGRVEGIAATVNVDELDTATRRARFHIEQGRASAKIKKPERALGFLLRAEKAAPLYVRTRPVVRELTGFLLRDAKRRLASGKLSEFAHRVGAA